MRCSASGTQGPEKLIVGEFKPSGGKHCWTTALRNVLDYHGLNLSEEMLFGLGGGIGFIYWYMKFMSAPLMGTRHGKGFEPLVSTCKRIGADATVLETDSPKKGYEWLKEQLRKGEPVFLFVDMAYLPYLALPEAAHFGAHTVVVYGLDEPAGKAYVMDRARKPFSVSIADLERARCSKSPPFPPKNRWLDIKYPKQPGNLKEGIRDAIRECCTGMLEPPIKNIGLAGLRKWAEMVPNWPAQFKGLHLFECLFNVFLYIEVSGTGGSAFRAMYVRFLDEAAPILGKPALKDVAEMFHESAALWSEIARAALPDSWPTLAQIRDLSSRKNRLFEEQEPNALEEMQKINAEFEPAMREAAEELKGERLTELLAALRRKILLCHDAEKRALEELASIVQ